MKNFRERVLQLVDLYSDGDKKAFSDKTGIPYSTLIEYCSGKKEDPKMSLLYKILVTFKDVNAFWLVTGETQTHYSIAAEQAAAYDTATSERIRELEIRLDSYENVFKLMGLQTPENNKPKQ